MTKGSMRQRESVSPSASEYRRHLSHREGGRKAGKKVRSGWSDSGAADKLVSVSHSAKV